MNWNSLGLTYHERLILETMVLGMGKRIYWPAWRFNHEDSWVYPSGQHAVAIKAMRQYEVEAIFHSLSEKLPFIQHKPHHEGHYFINVEKLMQMWAEHHLVTIEIEKKENAIDYVGCLESARMI